LPLSQSDVTARGHAFEARLYAEDPRRSFLPAGGTIRRLTVPAGARVDAAVETGDRVVTDYDALLAKLIVHASDRATALAELRRVLEGCRVTGVTTNLAALLALASDPEVAAGRVFTRLIDERAERLLPDLTLQQQRAATVAAGALLHSPAEISSPWEATDSWVVQGHGSPLVLLESADGTGFRLHECTRTDGEGSARIESDRVMVWLEGERHLFYRLSNAAGSEAVGAHGVVRAPMPGLILAVNVKQGDDVARGQPLLVMEAMKMEHTLVAGGAGKVRELTVSQGSRVRDGDALLRIEP
jgi:acetyl/propionyl-CoA carboxylase alpha subunit